MADATPKGDMYAGDTIDLYARTCPPWWVRLSKEGPVLDSVVATFGSVKDLYAIDLFVGDAGLMKEGPVLDPSLRIFVPPRICTS